MHRLRSLALVRRQVFEIVSTLSQILPHNHHIASNNRKEQFLQSIFVGQIDVDFQRLHFHLKLEFWNKFKSFQNALYHPPLPFEKFDHFKAL